MMGPCLPAQAGPCLIATAAASSSRVALVPELIEHVVSRRVAESRLTCEPKDRMS